MIPTAFAVRRRIALLMVLFFCLFLILSGRLFYLTVMLAGDMRARAETQWTSSSVISPRRGTIYDTNGSVLAMSATAYTVSVSPRQVADAAETARTLAALLGMDEQAVRKRVSDTSKGGVTIKRQVPRDTALRLTQMMSSMAQTGVHTLDGVYLDEDSKRYYPYGAFACQLLGITSIDGVGQAGLEATLNQYLAGSNGRVETDIDGRGRALENGSTRYVPSEDGKDVYLTIDASIQSYAEKAAREAMAVNGAASVRVLVMNPNTGAIYAMVNKPDYDLNDPPRNDIDLLTERMRNRLVSDAYEPGSTFKIVTTAAALESGVTNIHEGFYCSGSILVEGGRVKCWGNPHGAESMAEALQNSCNPVFVELGLRLGIPRFYRFLDAFGLGKKTGIDISGEIAGIVIREDKVKRVDLARIGFGQSIAVTPVQLLSAACTAINGGNRITPFVVKEIVDGAGNRIKTGGPVICGSAISADTSATMRKLLEDVVTHGGGRNAYIEGYRVGGKTGTAQVYVDGQVSTDTHIGSFIGFAPMDDPQIAVLFIVDEAEKSPDYGSVTAAPFARDILLSALTYLGVPREETGEPVETGIVPDVSGMAVAAAIERMEQAGFACLLDGAGAKIVDQLPAAGAEMTKNSIVMLYVEGAAQTNAEMRAQVPDVTGMTITQSNRLLVSYGLELTVSGSGIAVAQSPAAGEFVYPTTSVRVWYEKPDG